VVQRQYHKPYGEIAWQWTAGGSLTNVGFTGQRLDSDSGLMYYGARFYDPALGYFASADTMGVDKGASQTRNRYAYALNNPLRYRDPTGHCADDGTHNCGPSTAERIAADKAALEELGFRFDETCPGCLQFSLLTLDVMLEGVRALMAAAGWTSPEQFKAGIGLRGAEKITLRATDKAHMKNLAGCDNNAPGCTGGRTITINQQILSDTMRDNPDRAFIGGEETFVHELGHAWSNIHKEHTGESLAHEMFQFTHYREGRDEWVDRETPVSYYGGHSGDGGRTYSEDEDWAETVAGFVFHDVDPGRYLYWTVAQERQYFIGQQLGGH